MASSRSVKCVAPVFQPVKSSEPRAQARGCCLVASGCGRIPRRVALFFQPVSVSIQPVAAGTRLGCSRTFLGSHGRTWIFWKTLSRKLPPAARRRWEGQIGTDNGSWLISTSRDRQAVPSSAPSGFCPLARLYLAWSHAIYCSKGRPRCLSTECPSCSTW